MRDWKVSKLESVRIRKWIEVSYAMICITMVTQASFAPYVKNLKILKLSDSDTFRFWHFSILTLSNSDTFRFWHFPIMTLSNSDTFQFWRFPIPTLSNPPIYCVFSPGQGDPPLWGEDRTLHLRRVPLCGGDGSSRRFPSHPTQHDQVQPRLPRPRGRHRPHPDPRTDLCRQYRQGKHWPMPRGMMGDVF